jgi:hypothetical protein
MAINWWFPTTEFDTGGDAASINFNKSIEAALREGLQNAIDARWDSETVPVHIDLIVLQNKALKKDFLEALKFDDLKKHLKACFDEQDPGNEILDHLKHGLENIQKNQALLLLKISDYKTTGLYGKEKKDPSMPSNAYRGLMWSSNRSTGKGTSSGGSFGMGKIAYSGISNIRTVLVNSNIATTEPIEGVPNSEIEKLDLTKFTDDKSKNRFLGRADFISHTVEGDDFAEHGRFGNTTQGVAESVWDDRELIQKLYLERGRESGTTILIPAIFTTERITDKPNNNYQQILDDINTKIVKNFWPALYKGNLQVKTSLTVDNEKTTKTSIDPEDYVPNYIDLLKKYENSLEDPFENLDHVTLENVEKIKFEEETAGYSVNLEIPKTRKDLSEDLKDFAHETTSHDVAVLVKKVDISDLSEIEKENVNTFAQFRGPGIIVEYTNREDSMSNMVKFDTLDNDIISIGVYGNYKQEDQDAVIADRFLRWIEPPHHDRWNPDEDTASKWKMFYDTVNRGNKEAANSRYVAHTALVSKLFNYLFREIVTLKEDTPEYQKKLLTVKFSGKKPGGGGGGGGTATKGGIIIPQTKLSYNNEDKMIYGFTEFTIPTKYKKDTCLNVDITSVLVDGLGKDIFFEILNSSNNLGLTKNKSELKINKVSQDNVNQNKAAFEWRINTSNQNIQIDSLAIELQINKVSS